MNKLIVETDLGRDPDDFFALCYLIATGQKFDVWMIGPGDCDQLAVARFIKSELNVDVAIWESKTGRSFGPKRSSGGMHYQILREYGHSLESPGGDDYCTILKEGDDVFVCGPPTGIRTLLDDTLPQLGRLTMQGGFIGYDCHDVSLDESKKLDKFRGLTTCSTFNMGGDVQGTLALLEAPFTERRFVGKNVCHTILYDEHIHKLVKDQPDKHPAITLMYNCIDYYLQKQPVKAFHDPLAAVLHLHPEIGVWVNATPYRENGKWGSRPDNSNNYVLVDVNRDKFWEFIINGV